MQVHHLNCISSCPLGGKIMDEGPESLVQRGHLTNHCLLIETGSSLVLVDTGFGLKDVAQPRTRMSEFFLALLKPEFREELTAYRQIQRLGFNPKDVRHIILTHLDFDHAGGLDDFPWARVHLLQSEKESAMMQKTWLDRQRYRPQQWSTKDNWQVYLPDRGDHWFGFRRVNTLNGLPPEITLVPLIGHTFGHAGVAVKKGDKWLLDAGDAYFFHGEMHEHPHCTPGLMLYQNFMDKDHGLRVKNQHRLRELKKFYSHEVDVFCSHDVLEFERLAQRSPEIPADKLYNQNLSAI